MTRSSECLAMTEDEIPDPNEEEAGFQQTQSSG